MKFVFKAVLSIYERVGKEERKVVRLVLELLRRTFIWFGDPPYSMEVRGKKLTLPISHKLPIYIIDFPLYDTLPARVTAYLRVSQHTLVMVDVGANVGDTLMACHMEGQGDRFLGVEANPDFVSYLKLNTIHLENFVLVPAFCHSGVEKEAHIRVDSVGGTARVHEVEEGLAIAKRTLDEILDEHSEFKNFNFLKLDTDGSDFAVLKGAQRSLSTSHPVILMECDVFENMDYVDDFLSAMDFLAQAGYTMVVAYDNFGNYFSTFPVNDPSPFLDALAYQIVSEFGYFDLLVLRKEDEGFIQNEKEFFFSYAKRKGLSETLRKALMC